VGFLYGDSIRALMAEGLKRLGVTDVRAEVEDQGAVPFVLMARLETAVRRARTGQQTPEYLPPLNASIRESTSKDRRRWSRLYLPGNEPKYMLNVKVHRPDAVILDLEDSVAPDEKDAALVLVRNALRAHDFGECERMVRINQLPKGLEEIPCLVEAGVQLLLIPKCESGEQVRLVDETVQKARRRAKAEQDVYLMPIVESALGVAKAYEIASAAPSVAALTIGLEDYTADMGIQRTKKGRESFWARSEVVNAARAAGVQAIDTVFSDVGDMDGLKQSALEAKSLGFEGKGCIHPRQIDVVHQALAPTSAEIEKAVRIVLAFERAQQENLGVVALGSKMIDRPVVKRALRTVEVAVAAKLLPENWREREGRGV